MNTVCFYHGEDFDGIGSAAIVHNFLEAELIPLYRAGPITIIPWNKLSPASTVFVCDYTLSPFHNMLKIYDYVENFIWLDHHISALREADTYNVHLLGKRDIAKAACELTWEWFADAELPWAIKMLGRFDVWDFQKHPQAVSFQYGLKSYKEAYNPKNIMWAKLLKNDKDTLHQILNRGSTILKYMDVQWEENLQNAFAVTFEGHTALALNLIHGGRLAFNHVKDPEEYDILITFYRKNSVWGVTLFSNKPNVDVSKIAKKYGGGGHSAAAGFGCESLPFIET